MPDQWVSLAAPAVVFWAGVLLAWASADPGWARMIETAGWLTAQSTIVQIGAGLGALTVVGASVVVVRRLTTPVLRLLEGYWPTPLDRIADRRRSGIQKRKAADDNTWQTLMGKMMEPTTGQEQTEPTARQREELARLEHRRRHRPVRDNELLPTRVGNILRSAESRPGHRYGLDAVVVWPRLWLVLPEIARTELAGARAALDAAVAAAIWGTGFLAVTIVPGAWWAAPAGLAVAVTATRWWVPARAEVFADLVETAYDLYRGRLYQQLRWP
ncbi:hypothetical protein, partial [Kocuria arenosa]|uniref:hypothetical protein n=1 Tax=Kocuria arenosa TaxID=3071446 RepID=UPI0034D41574